MSDSDADPAPLWRAFQWAVRALAQEADVQIGLFPDFAEVVDELQIDFEQTLLPLKEAVPKDELEALPELWELDRQLEAIAGPKNAAFYTLDALRAAEEWREIRKAARHLLKIMRWPSDPPPTDRAIYVGPDPEADRS